MRPPLECRNQPAATEGSYGMSTAHWLFGDQLGPHFADARDGGPAPDSRW